MGNRRHEGWLFDLSELGSQIALWVYLNDGRLVRLTQEFHPPIYVSGERPKLRRLAYEMSRSRLISKLRWAEQREFWSGNSIEVLELQIRDSSLLPKLRRLAASYDREFTFYNSDIPTAQYYLYLNNLFPLCRMSCEADEAGNVQEIAATDSALDIDYGLPKLKTLIMRGQQMRPASAKSTITLDCSGQHILLRLREGASVIHSFNGFIKRHDPDLIISEHGDGVLFPALLRLAKKHRLDLALDRDKVVTRRRIVTEGRTFYSYGAIIYKGPSYPLIGRWHIDAHNSFMHREAGLIGVIELARLAKVPVQRMARTSPGSAMSSMQMDRAVQDGILIPSNKSEPEAYKTARELLTIDKGGLTYQPKLGAFEQVAEIDYASMYPAIMVRHNISPETVLCSCCENRAVPEANYNVCEKRQGLIPRTLEPVLDRRRRYKQLKREAIDQRTRNIYEARQTAIKWMLVSCFGYLGYKNARFGRIEAHEAVTAFGRDKLLRAKELAEARGYRVLHALTDSLWLKQESISNADVLALCEEITHETQIEMALEGIYNWIIFLPSKQNDKRPVACRYYGMFDDGKLKLRGLACCRSDTPEFIKGTQWEMLIILAQAGSLKERSQLIEQAEAVLSERIGELERVEVDPKNLLMRRTLTKEIDDYVVDTRTAIAARQMQDAGIKTHAGERVNYVIINARAKDKSRRVRAEEVISGSAYDAAEYIALLKSAAAEVIF